MLLNLQTLGGKIKEHRYLIAILILSAVIKAAFLVKGGVVNNDAATYIAAASKYSQGLFSEGLSFYRMPLYPLILSGVNFFIRDWVLSGQMITISSLIFSIIPLYLITDRIYGRGSALCTATLFAVLPDFNTVATSIIRDPIFLLVFLLSLLALVISVQDKNLSSALWGTVFAVLAMLFRIEGFFLLLIAMSCCVFQVVRLSETERFRFVALFVLLLLFLGGAGYGLVEFDFGRNARINDIVQWANRLLSLDAFSNYQRIMDALKELQSSLPAANLGANLIETTRHYAPLIYAIGLLEVLGKAVFPTTLVAVFALWFQSSKEKRSGAGVILLAFSVFFCITYLFLLSRNFIQGRYFWIPIVLSLSWFGSGISLFLKQFGRNLVVFVLLVLFFFAAPVLKTMTYLGETEDLLLIDSGGWVNSHLPVNKKASAFNDRRILIYAGLFDNLKRVYKNSRLQRKLKREDSIERVFLYLPIHEKARLPDSFSLVDELVGTEKKLVVYERSTASGG